MSEEAARRVAALVEQVLPGPPRDSSLSSSLTVARHQAEYPKSQVSIHVYSTINPFAQYSQKEKTVNIITCGIFLDSRFLGADNVCVLE